MYKCKHCDFEFEHPVDSTEFPTSPEVKQVCPRCQSAMIIKKKEHECLLFLGFNERIYWGLGDFTLENKIVALLSGNEVIMDKLEYTFLKNEPTDYLKKFPKNSKVKILGAAKYFEEDL